MGDFAHLNWYVQQRDEYIHADEVLFGRSRLSHADRAQYVVDRLGIQPEPDADRKVFLTRRPPAQRLIANAAEIEELVGSMGFETVDTSDWSLADQIELFRRTRVLMAVHGAGLTNMMFRAGSPMTVIELGSRHWTTRDFRTLAIELGFTYERLLFPAQLAGRQHADFRVDPGRLVDVLRRLAPSGP
jgi:capsular polysaccharide biosynthesis protein